MKKALSEIILLFSVGLLLCGCSAGKDELSLFQNAATPSPADTPAVTATPSPTPSPSPVPTPSPTPANRSQTSGRIIPEGTPSRPVIVSIENSDGAKPQTGLMEADILYEFMVESMITRFQALYNDDYPAYAGPLRSMRYYFVDLAQEWDCMYLHEGGVILDAPYKRIPSKAIALYPRKDVREFNGFTKAFNRRTSAYNDTTARNGYRFRSKERNAPHNLYVLVERTVAKYYGDHEAAIRNRFDFQEGIHYDQGEAFTTVSLPYLNQFNPNWIQFSYRAGNNRLYRSENDNPFMVRGLINGGDDYKEMQLSVQNLIVQYVKYGKVPDDDKGRRTCELTGSGKCDYFINGQHVSGTWSRPTLDDFTSYMLEDGSTVVLEPGNTFIAMHPDNVSISWS